MKAYFLQLALIGLAYSLPTPARIRDALPLFEALCMPVWPVVARQVLVASRLGIYQELMEYSEP